MNTPTSLQIGHLHFDSPLIQGPLAGYTCSAMRRLPWRYGGLAYTVTEMLSAHQLAHDQDRSPRYTHVASDEGPVCFQLSGSNPDLLAKASEKAEKAGASLIDLNAGCPQPKIRKKGHGSALLTDSKQLAALLSAIKQHSSCPVTLKIRVDRDTADDYNHIVLDAAHQANLDALIVHGRHWKERYDSNACHDSIAWFVEQADVPVIGNGDLDSPESIDRFFKHTKAAGAMIARASLGQPWLFAAYHARQHNKHFTVSDKERWQCFLDHVEALAKLEESEIPALNQARGFLKYYYPNLNDSERNLFFKQNSLSALKTFNAAKQKPPKE